MLPAWTVGCLQPWQYCGGSGACSTPIPLPGIGVRRRLTELLRLKDYDNRRDRFVLSPLLELRECQGAAS